MVINHRHIGAATLAALATTIAPAFAAQAAEPTPLPHAHSHNDYEHTRPLLDALDHGFTSVEADVWLSGGQLCLGHIGPDCRLTLEANYLAPLQARADEHGTIHPGMTQPFQLLIEIKTDAADTWPAIEKALAAHPNLFMHWKGAAQVNGPVRAVITGNRSLAAMAAAPERWSGYDGTPADLDRGIPNTLMPMVSEDWGNAFSWRGEGRMPAEQRVKLNVWASKAKKQGIALRFWATPDWGGPVFRYLRENVWATERAAGVEWLNSDDLPGLAAWLRSHPTP